MAAFVPGGTAPAKPVTGPAAFGGGLPGGVPTVNLQNLAKALQAQNAQGLQQTLQGIQRTPLDAGATYNQLKQITGGNKPFDVLTPINYPPGGGHGGGGGGGGGQPNQSPYNPAGNLALTFQPSSPFQLGGPPGQGGPSDWERDRKAAQDSGSTRQDAVDPMAMVMGGGLYDTGTEPSYSPGYFDYTDGTGEATGSFAQGPPMDFPSGFTGGADVISPGVQAGVSGGPPNLDLGYLMSTTPGADANVNLTRAVDQFWGQAPQGPVPANMARLYGVSPGGTFNYDPQGGDQWVTTPQGTSLNVATGEEYWGNQLVNPKNMDIGAFPGVDMSYG